MVSNSFGQKATYVANATESDNKNPNSTTTPATGWHLTDKLINPSVANSYPLYIFVCNIGPLQTDMDYSCLKVPFHKLFLQANYMGLTHHLQIAYFTDLITEGAIQEGGSDSNPLPIIQWGSKLPPPPPPYSEVPYRHV